MRCLHLKGGMMCSNAMLTSEANITIPGEIKRTICLLIQLKTQKARFHCCPDEGPRFKNDPIWRWTGCGMTYLFRCLLDLCWVINKMIVNTLPLCLSIKNLLLFHHEGKGFGKSFRVCLSEFQNCDPPKGRQGEFGFVRTWITGRFLQALMVVMDRKQ